MRPILALGFLLLGASSAVSEPNILTRLWLQPPMRLLPPTRLFQNRFQSIA